MNHRIYTSSHKNNAIVIKNNLKDLGDKSLKKLEKGDKYLKLEDLPLAQK